MRDSGGKGDDGGDGGCDGGVISMLIVRGNR